MDLKIRFRTFLYCLISFGILTGISVFLSFCQADRALDSFLDLNYFDLLLGQIANTLIVLSLTSVLSSNFGQAYWVDIKDSKLIHPFWSCFIGITVYLLTGMVYSMAAYCISFSIGVVVSFTCSTILLIILTFKMISIYFGKEEQKKQLKIEYQKLMILNHSPYVTDYLRRLQGFQEMVEQEMFPGKTKFLKKLKKEIAQIEAQLNSKGKEEVDRAHKEHIDIHIKGVDKRQEIDRKIEEYTKNAISNNDTEVVRENIELLVDSENYDTFFDLIEELFDWDEKYACRTLRELSKKNMSWIMKDRLIFFKQYALNKLIAESGKLDALQNLLLIYDATNLGLQGLQPKIKEITEHCRELQKRELELEESFLKEEDFGKAMKAQKESRKQLKAEYNWQKEKLVGLLEKARTKELRAFYVPIREAMIAYTQEKFDIANRYLMVILTNFEQDKFMIKAMSGITEVDSEITFRFSYVTEEEAGLIQQLIERDQDCMAIPEELKRGLGQLQQVVLDNNPMMDLTEDRVGIFKKLMRW